MSFERLKSLIRNIDLYTKAACYLHHITATLTQIPPSFPVSIKISSSILYFSRPWKHLEFLLTFSHGLNENPPPYYMGTHEQHTLSQGHCRNNPLKK
jgi:hypothetical protein